MTDVSTSRPATARGVMTEPGTGRATWAMGSIFEHVLDGDASGGTLGVAMVTQPPGIATPLHRHTREAEAFFLVEGRMSYQAGEEMFELYDGCFLYLPPQLPHAFRIRGDRPARILALTLPAGLLGLYDEVGIPAAERRVPGDDGQSMEVEIPKWAQVSPGYGLEVLGPPIPE
ncbi:MAG: cupin domain-containing protein [Actinomycetes bacterium]